MSEKDLGLGKDEKLNSALSGVRGSTEEAKKFVADPQAYLQAQGIDTSGLAFNNELSEDDLDQVAGGRQIAPGVCGSVGCVGCVTVGDDVAVGSPTTMGL